ncbi:MAG: hypothetical protein ACI85E_001995 [Marinomonas primoryensis]|jgi:hypothetical protein
MRISPSHETIEFYVFEPQSCHTNSLLPTASSAKKRREIRKKLFISRMNELMPWDQLEAVIEPFGLIRCLPCSAFTTCNISTT